MTQMSMDYFHFYVIIIVNAAYNQYNGLKSSYGAREKQPHHLTLSFSFPDPTSVTENTRDMILLKGSQSKSTFMSWRLLQQCEGPTSRRLWK